jgi:NAD(P)-dependent dehydrogenase (short-subunit alcohol dehydrogenase family)
MFVAKCSAERAAFLTAPHDWPVIDAAARDFLAALAAGDAALAAGGWPSPADHMTAYGASKALLNAYMLHLAASTELHVNACSPGFIDTDLVRAFLPDAKGALPPDAATRVILHLLFDTPRRGIYFGSDALRSPLDKYRAPGAPEYEP